ncbi:glycogen biosynthesis protein GlgD [Ectobacillus ponti]|uniref:Glycogen biosynthesis protein GlgD n=1 Tax=Ectobacillus ponti TaxID=2961894 RepID=A0AA41X8U5_9BACI|nr:glycogen biosynthesis protein GlgD [Ectobacillus ponti]MCP8967516.1 glycogen biosynthesis protein GlgD [Ectobacillus ponti]
MATRSDKNNPEQKTQNGSNPEYSNPNDPIVKSKQQYAKQGQPQRSKTK